jgi:hypothetical protein
MTASGEQRIPIDPQRSLATQLQRLAGERLAEFQALSFTSLGEVGPDPIHLTGRWGAKGHLHTEILKADDNTLRVAVVWGVSVWWWPGYHHAYDGFRIHRDGTRHPLTEADGYDLD